MQKITQEEYNKAIELGFTRDEALRGYRINTSDDFYGAEYIERVECLSTFANDKEAAEHAMKKHKINIVEDLPDCVEPDKRKQFIDTPENVINLKRFIKNTYDVHWQRTLRVVNRQELIDEIESIFVNNKEKSSYKTLRSCCNTIKSFREANGSLYAIMGENEYRFTANEMKQAVDKVAHDKEIDNIGADDLAYKE